MTDITSKQASDILLVKEENLLNWTEVIEKSKIKSYDSVINE